MRARLAFALLLALAMPALAQQTPNMPAGWIADPSNGCRVWNPNPAPNEAISWSGKCTNGIAEGRGVLQWFENGKPGGRYEGELRNGKYHGRGVQIRPGGARYEGEFRDGNYHGRGVYTFANGNRYEGEFRDGNFHGRGVQTTPKGDRYEGEFVADQRSGQGVATFADGSRYQGAWQDGKPNGYGKMVFKNGNVYEGTWAKGCIRQGNKGVNLFTTREACGFE